MKAFVIGLVMATSAAASEVSIGVFGIDAADLIGPNGETLNGAGIKIGQVEVLRPVDPDVDDSANSTINPAHVWVQQAEPTNNSIGGGTDPDDVNHPTWVAGIMISSDTTAKGVAPYAVNLLISCARRT